MSTLGGPNNVRDGLVLHIDAANNKCFRGEPTVNLINNPMPAGTTNFFVGGGVGTATYEAAEKAVRWVRTSYETWGAYYYNYSLANYLFDTGSTYTISFEWKFGPTHNAGTTHRFDIVQGNGSNMILGNYNLLTNSILKDDGWYYFSKTGVPANAGITQTGQPPQYRIICSNIIGKTTDIYWRELQFEKKSYATPFVDGERTGVATENGGLLDLSRSGSNIELSPGVTYTPDRFGTLNFDGVDDYMTTSSINFRTVSLWVNYYNTGSGWKYLIDARPAMANGWYTFNGVGNQWVGQYINGQPTSVSFSSVTINNWCNLVLVANVNYSGKITYMCRFSNTEFAGGKIAEIKVYDRVLSASEVLQNYNTSKSKFGL